MPRIFIRRRDENHPACQSAAECNRSESRGEALAGKAGLSAWRLCGGGADAAAPLYPQTLLSQEDRLLLAQAFGAVVFFEHDEPGAEQEFNLLLSLRPDFALDPLVDPLKAVAFLDDIRRRNEQRLEEIRRRQSEEEQRQKAEAEALQNAPSSLRKSRPSVCISSGWCRAKSVRSSLCRLGCPQLADGRTAVGTVLLVGEALTRAASAGAWLTVKLRYPDNTFPAREYTAAQALTGDVFGHGRGVLGAGAGGAHRRAVACPDRRRSPPAVVAAQRANPIPRSRSHPPTPIAPRSLFGILTWAAGLEEAHARLSRVL